jgi:hypothetical protein
VNIRIGQPFLLCANSDVLIRYIAPNRRHVSAMRIFRRRVQLHGPGLVRPASPVLWACVCGRVRRYWLVPRACGNGTLSCPTVLGSVHKFNCLASFCRAASGLISCTPATFGLPNSISGTSYDCICRGGMCPFCFHHCSLNLFSVWLLPASLASRHSDVNVYPLAQKRTHVLGSSHAAPTRHASTRRLGTTVHVTRDMRAAGWFAQT